VPDSSTVRATVRKSEQQRLAIIRYNYVSVEHVRGLSQRQIIGYLVEVPMVFSFLHSDGRKQESFSTLTATLSRTW
jgi:hypothetical protein